MALDLGLGTVLKAILSAIARFFGSLFQSEVHAEENLKRIVADFDVLKSNITDQIGKLKAHKFDPKWKSRVISPPAAIDHFKKIIDFIMGDWKKRMQTIVQPIHDLALIFKTETSDASDPTGAISGFSKAAVKVDEIATMIQQLAAAMDQIKEIDEMFGTIIDDIEKLEGLFLPQTRKPVYVEVRYGYKSRRAVKQVSGVEVDPAGTILRLGQELRYIGYLESVIRELS